MGIEFQITSFENASFVIFTVLLSRALIYYDLNFYIPISLVDENFTYANKCYSKEIDYKVKVQDNTKFHFRINIEDKKHPTIRKLTINEIFNGIENPSKKCKCIANFKGLIFYVRRFLAEKKANPELNKYIDFVSDKAKNKYISTSDFIRMFIINHKDYKNDSYINDEIADDLIDSVKKINQENSIEYLNNC